MHIVCVSALSLQVHLNHPKRQSEAVEELRNDRPIEIIATVTAYCLGVDCNMDETQHDKLHDFVIDLCSHSRL